MQGEGIRCAHEWWLDVLPDMKNRPINYVEIGVFCGWNVVSVAKNFATHPESKLYAIDPWQNYEGYNETYTQERNLNCFLHNIKYTGIEDKVTVCRGLSENILPTFEDNFFDIFYIDGSHLYDYVIKDCELGVKKTKKGGYIIVDDTNHPPIVRACDFIFNNAENNIKLVADKGDQRYYIKN